MLKKIISFKKTPSKIKPDQSGGLEQKPAANFAEQKELDKKLVYSLNKSKIPNLKQFKYLPRVLNSKQNLLLKGLLALIAVSLIFIVFNFYYRNFLPTPRVGGEYIEGLFGAPQYINPILSQTNDVDADISRLVFSGLMKYDRELQIVPDLAASWQESEDKKNYTFVLKENIKWHDGQPLSADDVVFTFKSIKDPDFKSPLLISLRGVEIEKVDNLTVKFILPEPYPAFLEVLTVGILPEHIWGEIPPINAHLTEYNLKPVGTGLWQFEKLTKDRLGNIKSYALIPNPNYYGPKPYIQRITFKFYPDFETGVSALKNHSVEGISFLPKDLKISLNGKKDINYYSFYLPQYTAVFFNQKANEILKEKNVRKALALSINKSKILSEALQLEGEIIDGPILPVSISPDPATKIEFNPNLANQILDEAGWQRITPQDYQDFIKKQEAEKQNQDSKKTETEAKPTSTEAAPPPAENKEEGNGEIQPAFYRKKDNTILAVTLTTVNQPENDKAARLIQEFWQNIGVKVSLQIVEGGKISREIIKPRNYQILLFGIIVGSNPDPYPFWHSSQAQDPGLNLALLANRDVDNLLENAKKTADPKILTQDYQKFYNILAEELPAIFLYNPTYTYVTAQKIKGINIDRIISPADRFNNIEDWYIKTKRTWQGKID